MIKRNRRKQSEFERELARRQRRRMILNYQQWKDDDSIYDRRR